MNKRNYQKELDDIIKCQEKPKTLFLHSCCAPCSSYVLEYLSKYFEITVFYYNPNISPESEYRNRVREIQRLIRENEKNYENKVSFIEGSYDPEVFYEMARGMEDLPERGKRCSICFYMRLKRVMEYALAHGYSQVTSVLGVSRYKNLAQVNEAAEKAARETGAEYIQIEGRKGGMQDRRAALIRELILYSQTYCGCKPRE